jgi:hypothetical protein
LRLLRPIIAFYPLQRHSAFLFPSTVPLYRRSAFFLLTSIPISLPFYHISVRLLRPIIASHCCAAAPAFVEAHHCYPLQRHSAFLFPSTVPLYCRSAFFLLSSIPISLPIYHILVHLLMLIIAYHCCAAAPYYSILRCVC